MCDAENYIELYFKKLYKIHVTNLNLNINYNEFRWYPLNYLYKSDMINLINKEYYIFYKCYKEMVINNTHDELLDLLIAQYKDDVIFNYYIKLLNNELRKNKIENIIKCQM